MGERKGEAREKEEKQEGELAKEGRGDSRALGIAFLLERGGFIFLGGVLLKEG